MNPLNSLWRAESPILDGTSTVQNTQEVIFAERDLLPYS